MQNLLEKYRPKSFEAFLGNLEAIEILKGFLLQEVQPLMITIIGSIGLGKTSLARIIAKIQLCLNNPASELKPCNACYYCKAIDSGFTLPNFKEIDCTRATAEEIRLLVVDVDTLPSFYNEKSAIILDEFQGLNPPNLRNMILKIVEKNSKVTWVTCIAEDKAQEIKIEHRSRGLVITLDHPDTETLIKWLEVICKNENILYSREGLIRIVDYADKMPRQCLTNLQKLSVLNKELSVDLVDKILPR